MNKILVTGSARSGTTICAKMRAQDLGFQFIDETEIGTTYVRPEASSLEGTEHSIEERIANVKWILNTMSNVVVQDHALFDRLSDLGDILNNILVVVVKREEEDVLDSADRLGWNVNDIRHWRRYLLNNWELSKSNIPNYEEVEYESLSTHPLWIPKNIRITQFTHMKQTSL